jgi:ribose transport system ATP-binding protein
MSKSFEGIKALSEVDYTVEEGEIHALLGENGAGKSTLMNLLCGVVPIDEGSVVFDGKAYMIPQIHLMEKAGVAFVHQERNVINDLLAFENIFLNRELTKGPLLDKKAMIAHTGELFKQLDVDINPLELVGALKTSEKQLLEICRALDSDAKLFILDEPTTSLSGEEVKHLFNILRRLRDSGKSFIFISHKLNEVFDIADRYTVLRNGKIISSGNIKDVTPHQITLDMVGEQYVDSDSYTARKLGDTALKLSGLTGKDFRGVDLEVRKGEIVAFTGLAGCGASELMQAIFGALPITGGSIEINGKPAGRSILGSMKSGVAMLPSNRKENSAVPDMNILENTYIAEHAISRRKPFISDINEIKKYTEFSEILSIKSETHSNPIGSLSGGNQQKVFLARWLNIGAEILLFDNPTQGIDVGAKVEIYKLILQFASEGKTIIINTLEIPEIKKVSDRCVVFYGGEIKKIFNRDEINEYTIMLYSTNAEGAAV